VGTSSGSAAPEFELDLAGDFLEEMENSGLPENKLGLTALGEEFLRNFCGEEFFLSAIWSIKEGGNFVDSPSK